MKIVCLVNCLQRAVKTMVCRLSACVYYNVGDIVSSYMINIDRNAHSKPFISQQRSIDMFKKAPHAKPV